MATSVVATSTRLPTSEGGLPSVGPDALDAFDRFRLSALSYPMLEAAEEESLARRWSDHQDVEAAHTLVTSHLRLVVSVVRKFRGYGLPLSDMASEGSIGLMRAVRGFDPNRGFRLSTYALWWIKAAVQDFIVRSWSLVRVGTTASQRKLFFGLRRARENIRRLSGPSTRSESGDRAINLLEVKAIAEEMDVSERDVTDMSMRLSGRDSSLNEPVRYGGDGDTDFGDQWIDRVADDKPSNEDVFEQQDEHFYQKGLLTEALGTLTDREQAIVRSRCLQEKPESLESLSKRFGVSRERIRQIEVRALKLMRSFVTERGVSLLA